MQPHHRCTVCLCTFVCLTNLPPTLSFKNTLASPTCDRVMTPTCDCVMVCVSWFACRPATLGRVMRACSPRSTEASAPQRAATRAPSPTKRQVSTPTPKRSAATTTTHARMLTLTRANTREHTRMHTNTREHKRTRAYSRGRGQQSCCDTAGREHDVAGIKKMAQNCTGPPFPPLRLYLLLPTHFANLHTHPLPPPSLSFRAAFAFAFAFGCFAQSNRQPKAVQRRGRIGAKWH